MRFEVIHTQWAVEGRNEGDDPVVFAGGVHDDFKLTKTNAPVFAAAEAAGSIVILDATDAERELLAGHVQSQEDGEAALEEARGDWVEPGQWSGPWRDGNLEQFELDVAAGVRKDTLELTDADVADAAEVLAAGDEA